MVPDTTVRLQSVLKALEQVIEPIMPEDASFAREQLALVKKSIALVIEQIPLELAYMMRDLREDIVLAQQVLARLEPDDPGRARLESSIAAAEAGLPSSLPDADALKALWLEMKVALEDTVDRLFSDASGELWDTLGRSVVEYSERWNLRERAWVAPTGFDPDPASLPSMRQAALGG